MNSKKQKEKKETKKFSIKRIFDSAYYSWQGLVYAYTNEQSLLLHGIATILMIIVGLVLQISFIEWTICIISSVVVLSIELLNTAIEATVDMVTKEFNPYAKIAKDCGSASAAVAGIAWAIICGFIFIEHIIGMIG